VLHSFNSKQSDYSFATQLSFTFLTRLASRAVGVGVGVRVGEVAEQVSEGRMRIRKI
jgi:hypothetical protein